jgi:hypothetical protein
VASDLVVGGLPVHRASRLQCRSRAGARVRRTLARRVLIALAAWLAPVLAHAQDEFEIQVYDAETAREGEPGLELHLNHHLIRAAADETHLTFEPHYGVAEWAELGGYFQTSLTTTGDLAYAGVKLRAKLRDPRRWWDERLGLAINFEVSAVPSRFEANVWGSEARPILDLHAGPVYAAVNPIVDFDLDGKLAGRPQLEPAVKLALIAGDHAMFGVEAYGAYGTFDALGEESVTRLFAVADLRGARWDLNAGLGVSRGSPDHPIAKLIVGIHP